MRDYEQEGEEAFRALRKRIAPPNEPEMTAPQKLLMWVLFLAGVALLVLVYS